MNYKVISLLSLISLSSNCLAKVDAGGFLNKTSFQVEPAYKPPIKEEKSKKLVLEDEAGSKPLVQINRGDLELTLGGVSKIENFFTKNIVMLNSSIPDETGYWRQIFDLTADLNYGERKFGHSAVQGFVNIRQKNMWGNTGKFIPTTSDPVKLDGTDVRVGSHSHKNTVPVLWLKDAWMRVSLNAVFDKPDSPLHFVKAGLFPFWVGRGIAYGPVFGSRKDFLGIYTGYQSDHSAPGVNLHGELVKDYLSYDLYYGKLEEKSSGLGETFNFVKANIVGRSQTPFRGVDKDNEIYLLRAKWDALPKGDRRGHLELEPYLFYNEASDRQIEFEADSKNELGSAGLAFEYKYKNFEWGGESTFNFGQSHIRALDRNIIVLARNGDDGAIREVYNKVKVGSASGSNVQVTNNVKTLVEGNKNPANSQFLGNVAGIGDLYNATNRFRPEYQNKYGGWMFVTDAAYKLDQFNLKVAGTYGFASGDVNPNDTEADKTYHGFVGLQEGYSGNRVPSVLVLNARKIRRPITLNDNFTGQALDDESFTDMHYFGLGGTWTPIEERPKDLSIQSNALFFWKDKTSLAYDSVNNTTADFNADNFLGVEWNIRLKQQAIKDMFVFCDFALFVPGKYYDDVKGTPLSGDVFSKLDEADQTGVEQSNFRLGNDSAFYINAGMTYKF